MNEDIEIEKSKSLIEKTIGFKKILREKSVWDVIGFTLFVITFIGFLLLIIAIGYLLDTIFKFSK